MGSKAVLKLFSARHLFFVTCAPGIEPVLQAEACQLKLAKCERQIGGIRFEGTMTDAWRANLELRTGIRVLLRLARFPAPDADALYRGVAEIPWHELISPEGTLWIDAQTRDSELTHSRFIAQRTKDAIIDDLRARTGARPDVSREAPSLRLHVHLYRNRATLSIDTSGDSLHKRGWRQAQGIAPLAETLAASLIRFAEWDGRAPLLDPFAGSGTIPIEAGLMASGTPVGMFRAEFGFERLPGHDAARFAALKRKLSERITVPRKLRLIGYDREPKRVEEARANAEAAGVGAFVSFERADARDFSPTPGWNAWVVTNPPYGQRLEDVSKLLPLYEHFGERLRKGCAGYTLALLTGNPRLADALDLRGLRSLALVNGGLEVKLLYGRYEPSSSSPSIEGAVEGTSFSGDGAPAGRG